MKRIFSLSFLLFAMTLHVKSQDIGLAGIYETGSFYGQSNSKGLRFFSSPFDTYSPFDFSFFADFSFNQRKFIDCYDCQTPDMQTKYRSMNFGAAITYGLDIVSGDAVIKTGLSSDFYFGRFSRQGQLSLWQQGFSSSAVGMGISFQVIVPGMFDLPLNLYFIVHPNLYLTTSQSALEFEKLEAPKSFFVLRNALGISYVF